MVTVPSPLEPGKIGEAVCEEGVTILLSTPTFLRSYHRKIDAEKFKSLRFAVAGAEKLPGGFAESFRQKFGIPVVEGYGLTETSPVLSVNIPNPELDDHDGIAGGARPGSVGRLLPGITARIVDLDTGALRSPLETGLLKVRGPNIFTGYLNDPERTQNVLEDGWFKTGDIARFDSDGFLFIEGRLSRFSKIGGEMVPHGTVEEKIGAVFGLEHGDQPGAVVVGIPDEAKGEALVLLTSVDLKPEQIREKLSGAGVPNLWIPKIVVRVDKIPMLGTGKVDLKTCQEMAMKKNSEPRTQNPES
jgi:acyl-[acyl-carrier-protein]-phospholipid O-acyltransferase/long-chain-fatty-acid--[acyl-carrier-protein] ligase